MINGMREFQNVLLVGTTSDIGNAILEYMPLSIDSKVFTVGKNTKSNLIFDLTTDALSAREIDSFFESDIDLAIIASGILGPEPSVSLDKESRELLTVNFTNSILLVSNITERMVAQGHGTIIVISSVAGLRPRKSNYVYGATKAGFDFYVRGLQNQVRKTNVKILIVRPGFVLTKMTSGLKPAPFSISSDSVGKIVSKAVRRQNKLVYAPPVLKPIFFVLRLLPDFIFRRIS